jgi:hypothetical protein
VSLRRGAVTGKGLAGSAEGSLLRCRSAPEPPGVEHALHSRRERQLAESAEGTYPRRESTLEPPGPEPTHHSRRERQIAESAEGRTLGASQRWSRRDLNPRSTLDERDNLLSRPRGRTLGASQRWSRRDRSPRSTLDKRDNSGRRDMNPCSIPGRERQWRAADRSRRADRGRSRQQKLLRLGPGCGAGKCWRGWRCRHGARDHAAEPRGIGRPDDPRRRWRRSDVPDQPGKCLGNFGLPSGACVAAAMRGGMGTWAIAGVPRSFAGLPNRSRRRLSARFVPRADITGRQPTAPAGASGCAPRWPTV